MKASYKIAWLLSAIFCVVVLAYDLWPSRLDSSTPESPALSDPPPSANNGLPAPPEDLAFQPNTSVGVAESGRGRTIDAPPSNTTASSTDQSAQDKNSAPDHAPTLTIGTLQSAIEPDIDASTTTLPTVRPTEESPDTTYERRYTVRDGDTFSSIAVREYGSERYWIQVAQANPLVDPMGLSAGQVIRLPSPEQVTLSTATLPDQTQAAKPSAVSALGAPTSPVGGFVIYEVKKGDSLFTIAKQFYQLPQLWRVIHETNRDVIGRDPNRLRAGMKLRIPPAPIPASP